MLTKAFTLACGNMERSTEKVLNTIPSPRLGKRELGLETRRKVNRRRRLNMLRGQIRRFDFSFNQ